MQAVDFTSFVPVRSQNLVIGGVATDEDTFASLLQDSTCLDYEQSTQLVAAT